jgi:Flp pilus assembly protein TadG
MQPRSRTFSFRRLSRRLSDDSRGTAAAEFAIILPAILAFAFGATEVLNLIALDRKLTLTARAVSDIVAQATKVNDADMANVLSSGKVLLQPYPDNELKIRVSAVNIDANKNATVVWSDASPPSEARGNGAVTIPAALLIANTQLIWGEVAYTYKPNFGAFSLKSSWTLSYENNNFFARPRESSGVCRSGCS